MIPIAMLAELQRVMAQNAAMAASASAPPGTLPFNPYELLAHGANLLPLFCHDRVVVTPAADLPNAAQMLLHSPNLPCTVVAWPLTEEAEVGLLTVFICRCSGE